MSFVQREIDRIRSALLADPEGERYQELYAAQQALSWALEPNGFGSPIDVIMGTRVVREDCRVEFRPPSSSDTSDQAECQS